MSTSQPKKRVPAKKALQGLTQSLLTGSNMFANLTAKMPAGTYRQNYEKEIRFFSGYLPMHLFFQGMAGTGVDPHLLLDVGAEAVASAFAATERQHGIPFQEFQRRIKDYSALGAIPREQARQTLVMHFAALVMGVSTLDHPAVDPTQAQRHIEIGCAVYDTVEHLFHDVLSTYALYIEPSA
jgi:hypothetical protein